MNAKEMEKRIVELSAKCEDLENKIKALEEKSVEVRNVRDRGPSSTREMTEEDAEKIMIGDLKMESHRKCAELLGLSYGQVYSARGGYTFKGIYKKAEDLKKANLKANAA